MSYLNLNRLLTKIESLTLNGLGKGYGALSIVKEVKALKQFLFADPGLAIDVGANIGDYSNQLKVTYPNLEIHLFEPSETNYIKLAERFKKDTKIVLNNNGLSNVNSTAELYSNIAGSALGSLTKRKLDHFNIDFNVHETVNLIRFEEYWRSNLQLREIDIAKIDVEGHELEVLKGFGDAINKTKIIQFEFGGCNIDTRTYFQDYWYFFKDYNFKIYRITPFGLEHIWRYTENHETFLTTNFICVNQY